MSTSSSPALSYGPPQIAFSFSCPLSTWKQFFVPSERYSGLASKKVLGLDSKKVGKKEPLMPRKSFSKTKITYNCMKRSIGINMFFCLERCPGMVGIVNACSFARVCFQESIVLTTRSKKESRQHGIREHDIVASAFALAFSWLMCEAIPPWCHACDYWYQERRWVSLQSFFVRNLYALCPETRWLSSHSKPQF